MEYYLDELDPLRFQRLLNVLLTARYGMNCRLLPLRGADGGRDAEVLPADSFYEATESRRRYIFQIKHHRTEHGVTSARARVIEDLRRELAENVMRLAVQDEPTSFFLVTNVPASKQAWDAVETIRSEIGAKQPALHIDVWWKEVVTALLDAVPSAWVGFPEIFAGRTPPVLAQVASRGDARASRAFRLAAESQYRRDQTVRFRQVELENDLGRLFVEPDLLAEPLLTDASIAGQQGARDAIAGLARRVRWPGSVVDVVPALALLSHDAALPSRRLVLEGGPGQGKSTLTQMYAQVHRALLLGKPAGDRSWTVHKARYPFRIDLRNLAQWVESRSGGTLEEYLTAVTQADAGGASVSVDDLHQLVTDSPICLIFDGLDEIGNESLRDSTLRMVLDACDRFANGLGGDIEVIITARPPAIAGRAAILNGFTRTAVAPLTDERVQEYVARWCEVQVSAPDVRRDVLRSFSARRHESHVAALVRNPMQLSVLLHFIRLKGAAFPSRRAELYRDYFQVVIDRDVEKSDLLRTQRELIETLHQYVGYRIHALVEAEASDGTMSRAELIQEIQRCVGAREGELRAEDLFKVGEERLGLLVIVRGDGNDARYGFEIQPVREYFAAAYFTNHSLTTPSNLFGELITRPYWREVALFFAGLRRPNEKADLVLQARRVDNIPALAFRNYGKGVIAQLLSEGVLGNPPHVYDAGLEFVVEAWDPRRVPATPWRMLRPRDASMPSLMGQSTSPRLKRIVKEIYDVHRANSSAHGMYRWMEIARGVLSDSELLHMLLAATELSVDVRAAAIFLWSQLEGVDQSAAFDPELIAEFSEESVARWSWLAFVYSGGPPPQVMPEELHSHFFWQLAYGTHARFLFREPGRASSNEGAWIAFCIAEQFAILQSVESIEKLDLDKVCPISEALSVAGLDHDTGESIRQVYNGVRDLLLRFSGRAATVSDVAACYGKLAKPLRQGGVVGAVAARLAVCVYLAFLRTRPRDQRSGLRYWNVILARFPDAGKLLSQYYRPEIIERIRKGSPERETPAPFAVVENGASLTVADWLNAKHLSGNSGVPALTMEFAIDALVHCEPGREEEVLHTLALPSVDWMSWCDVPPSTTDALIRCWKARDNFAADVQAVLTAVLCRCIDDERVPLDVALDVLAETADLPNVVSSVLGPFGRSIDREESVDRRKEALALAVLGAPDQYPLAVRDAAADLLCWMNPTSAPPILEKERDLCILEFGT